MHVCVCVSGHMSVCCGTAYESGFGTTTTKAQQIYDCADVRLSFNVGYGIAILVSMALVLIIVCAFYTKIFVNCML